MDDKRFAREMIHRPEVACYLPFPLMSISYMDDILQDGFIDRARGNIWYCSGIHPSPTGIYLDGVNDWAHNREPDYLAYEGSPQFTVIMKCTQWRYPPGTMFGTTLSKGLGGKVASGGWMFALDDRTASHRLNASFSVGNGITSASSVQIEHVVYGKSSTYSVIATGTGNPPIFMQDGLRKPIVGEVSGSPGGDPLVDIGAVGPGNLGWLTICSLPPLGTFRQSTIEYILIYDSLRSLEELEKLNFVMDRYLPE